MKPLRLPAILALLASAGCGSNTFPSYTQLGGLRVLAIQTTAPEVAPGTSTTLTVVLSDINGAGRQIQETIQACADPGIGVGANPTCAGASDLVNITAPSAFSMSSPAYTAALSAVTVTVPSNILSNRSSVDQFNGVAYLVTFNFAAVNGTGSVTAFKRIIASNKNTFNYAFNNNPSISGITNQSGAAVTTLPSQAGTVYPSISSTSAEVFPVMASNGSISNYLEVLTTTWFASDGGFDVERTQSTNGTGYTPPTARPSGHNVVLVVVTRDGRGGESYVNLSL